MGNFSSEYYRTVKTFAESLAHNGVRLLKKLRSVASIFRSKAADGLQFAVVVWCRDETGGALHYSFRSTYFGEKGRDQFRLVLSRIEDELAPDWDDVERGPLGLPLHKQ